MLISFVGCMAAEPVDSASTDPSEQWDVGNNIGENMAGEDYTSDGTVWHPTLNLVLDGEPYNFESIQKSATPKRGLFGKLLDNVTYVKNLFTNGATVGGPIVLSGSSARIVLRPPVTLADNNQTLTLTADVFRVPAITAPRTYTLPLAAEIGRTITIVKHNDSNFDVTIQRDSGDGTIVTFDGGLSVYSSATFIARGNGPNPYWSLMTWAGGTMPVHDP